MGLRNFIWTLHFTNGAMKVEVLLSEDGTLRVNQSKEMVPRRGFIFIQYRADFYTVWCVLQFFADNCLDVLSCTGNSLDLDSIKKRVVYLKMSNESKTGDATA